MNHPANRPDPAELLETFVASNHCDKAFAALVESLDRLVYSSALRRTGSPQLAEEVAQDVFAIMARKADSLQRHPCLAAWALKTTKLQCRNAMRSERRRQRKIAALTSDAEARHAPTSMTTDDQATWKDAVPLLDDALDRLSPLDQKLILERFYEEKKFVEIASATGTTEAACKMRVQRSLKKIFSFLTARGVTLTGTTAVGSLLGAEFARAVPSHASAALAPKALAASSSISTPSLIANTLQTMSTAKSITLTAAAILAIFAIPIAQQRAEGSRLLSELDALARDPEAPDLGLVRTLPQTHARGNGLPGTRTATKLLASLNQPANNRVLIRSLITGDSLGKAMAQARINEMNSEEISALLEDIKRFPIDDFMKRSPLSTVDKFAQDQSPQARVERLVAAGWDPGSGRTAMFDWARSEPDAALAWYREKRASGALYPGLNDDLHEDFIGDLLYGLAESNPASAFDLYREVPRDEMNGVVPIQMAAIFAKEIMKSGEETSLARMLEFHSGKDRQEILSGAFGEFARAGRLDEGMALVDRHNPVPEERTDYLENLIRREFRGDTLRPGELEGGIDWMLANTQEAEVIQRVTHAFAKRDRDLAQRWAQRQEPGFVRDVTYAGIADRMSTLRRYPEALTTTEGIDDATLRAETRRIIGQRWLERDREAAEQKLPAELLQQLQNQ